MTEKEVRQAVAAIVSAAAPSAKVYEWNALSHDLADWPGLFKIAGGVHGWIIKRTGGPAEWKNNSRERRTWNYDIWGFYGFRSGKAGDNSDDEFGAIVDAIAAGFKAEPRLGDLDEVERHELLQIVHLTTINCGEQTLHFANCRLQVKLCC